MKTVPLAASASGVFNASGRAIVRLGPARYNERWHVIRQAVTTTSDAPTTLTLYRQQETPSAQLDFTRSGNNDTSLLDDIDLTPQETLIYVWTGGTSGRVATANVYGEIRSM